MGLGLVEYLRVVAGLDHLHLGTQLCEHVAHALAKQRVIVGQKNLHGFLRVAIRRILDRRPRFDLGLKTIRQFRARTGTA